MAALGKIRSKGVLLVTIIGLALFAFVAEEFFRACETTRNESRQKIGEINGESISVQDYQKLIDEYADVMKITQGRDNLTDAELTRLKDQVWGVYVQNKLIEAEAKKLGLTVTDGEMQRVLSEGTNPSLLQTPFINQQTRKFDVTLLTKFLAEYKTMDANQSAQAAEQYKSLYNYWLFVEKSLKQQLLAQKYQVLLSHCLISNPVSAKMNFDGKNTESKIQLAVYPYSSLKDNDVNVTDEDLKAEYKKEKEQFKQYVETRDIKYVAFRVQASAEDRENLKKEVAETVTALQGNEDPAVVVRKSNSLIGYIGVPVTAKAYPADVVARLDSNAVGSLVGPYENAADNSYNVIKIISKASLPDSIEFRQIQVVAQNIDDVRTKADSIMKALQGGADFEELAKKYGQTGAKNWLTSEQYENSTSLDRDTRTYLNTLNSAAVNELKNLEFTASNVIIQVTARKAFVNKYVAAVVKRTFDFSKETYSQAYNKFSQMVSASTDVATLEKKAAEFGFKVMDREEISNTEHYVAGLNSTREALKWIFEAKEGQVSPLYECGNNDHLLVCAMTKIHPVGYRSFEDVKDMLQNVVLKDKKAEKIMADLAGVNSIQAAQAKKAQVSEIEHVTFAPAYVPATGTSEPALSGAVASTEKGKFSAKPVKGNGGVYLFLVEEKTQREGVKFDAKSEERELSQRAMQAAGRYMNELYLNAKIVDNRYLFF